MGSSYRPSRGKMVLLLREKMKAVCLIKERKLHAEATEISAKNFPLISEKGRRAKRSAPLLQPHLKLCHLQAHLLVSTLLRQK